jgi:hypothetical protein
MIATRNWSTIGSLIHTERPLAVLPSPLDAPLQGRHCDYCLTPLVTSNTPADSATPHSCDTCGVRYCSPTCQQQSIADGHELLCGYDTATALKQLPVRVNDTPIAEATPALPSQADEWISSSVPRFPYLAARLLTRHLLDAWTPATASKGSNGGIWNTALRRLCSSQMETERFHDDYHRYINQLGYRLSGGNSYSSEQATQMRTSVMATIPMQLYLHVMGILHLNVFAIHDNNGQGQKVGTVLFNNASFFNHSCEPLIKVSAIAVLH